MQEVFLKKKYLLLQGEMAENKRRKESTKKHAKKSGKKLSTIIPAQFVPKIGQN